MLGRTRLGVKAHFTRPSLEGPTSAFAGREWCRKTSWQRSSNWGSSALLVIGPEGRLLRRIQAGGVSGTVYSDETEVAMDVISALLPDSTALRLEKVSISQGIARLVVSSTRPAGVCPVCGRVGSRVHSHYERKLLDLPWQGTSVLVLWRTRKFFCDTTPGCPRQVFTERLPRVAAPYARRTSRMGEIVACLGRKKKEASQKSWADGWFAG
jgi:hypothetical protein